MSCAACGRKGRESPCSVCRTRGLSQPTLPIFQEEQLLPIRETGRLPEHGRIRLGIKGTKYPKSIDTLRFTSPDKRAIEQLADHHGGSVSPWRGSSVIKDQWEVISEAKEIEVLVPPDPISTSYELWAGPRRERTCDGEICELPPQVDDEGSMHLETVDCICNAKQRRECDPKTRLNVILPDLDFAGVWRLDTGSWNALNELPGMVQVLEALQRSHMVSATLGVQRRQRPGKSFVVPTLRLNVSVSQLEQGVARPVAVESGTQMELEAPPDIPTEYEKPDVVDAEVVEEWDSFNDVPPDIRKFGVKRNERGKYVRG